MRFIIGLVLLGLGLFIVTVGGSPGDTLPIGVPTGLLGLVALAKK